MPLKTLSAYSIPSLSASSLPQLSRGKGAMEEEEEEEEYLRPPIPRQDVIPQPFSMRPLGTQVFLQAPGMLVTPNYLSTQPHQSS